MAKSRAIANLAVVISARTKQFQKGFARASKTVEKWKKKIIASITAISKKMALFGAALGAGLAYSIVKSTKRLDALAKSADRLTIIPERLQAMRYAARLAGMETETLDKSLLYLRRRLSEANSGLSTSADAFKMLGLNIEEMLKLPLHKQLTEVGKGLDRIANPADRVRVSMDLFGRSGAAMINLLAGGSRAIDEASAKLKRFGGLFNRRELRGIEAFNDSMETLTTMLETLRDRLAVKVAPYLSVLTDKFGEILLLARGLGDTLVDGFKDSLVPLREMVGYLREAERISLERKLRWTTLRRDAEQKALNLKYLPEKMALKVASLASGIPSKQGPLTSDALQEWDEKIHKLEDQLGKLDKGLTPKTDRFVKWLKEFADEVNAAVVEKLKPPHEALVSRVREWMISIMQRVASKLPVAAVAGGAVGDKSRGVSKLAWGQVSQTRTAFPSGVGAVAQVKKQPVEDKGVVKVLVEQLGIANALLRVISTHEIGFGIVR